MASLELFVREVLSNPRRLLLLMAFVVNFVAKASLKVVLFQKRGKNVLHENTKHKKTKTQTDDRWCTVLLVCCKFQTHKISFYSKFVFCFLHCFVDGREGERGRGSVEGEREPML